MTDEETRRKRMDESRKFTKWLRRGRHDPMRPDDVRIAGNLLPRPAHLTFPITRNPLGSYERSIA